MNQVYVRADMKGTHTKVPLTTSPAGSEAATVACSLLSVGETIVSSARDSRRVTSNFGACGAAKRAWHGDSGRGGGGV
jgi:hypothetical protein